MRVHGGLVLALLAAVAVWWLLEHSTLGFRLRAVGANPFAARTAGMSVGDSYTTVMLLAGALARPRRGQPDPGHRTRRSPRTSTPASASTRSPSRCSGRANPVGTVLAGPALRRPARGRHRRCRPRPGRRSTWSQVIQALIVLFIAAPALVRSIFRLKDLGRRRRLRAGEGVERMSTAAAARRRASSSSTRSSPETRSRGSAWSAGLRWSLLGLVTHLVPRRCRSPRPGRGAPARWAPPTRAHVPDLAVPGGPPRLGARRWSSCCSAATRSPGGAPPARCPGCSPRRSCSFMVAFLCWAAPASGDGRTSTLVSLLRALDRAVAVPLILGALAGVLCERSGVINVAIEGQLLAGAFGRRRLIGSVVRRLSFGLVGGDRRRRADRRAAGRLRDPLPGQPGGPRRRAERVRARSDRLLLRRVHAARRRRR